MHRADVERAELDLQVRITKTMNLGAYMWWGVIVFCVELLGASTTVLYGLNLILLPVNESPVADEERHGLTKVCPWVCM